MVQCIQLSLFFQKGVDVVYESIGGDMFDACVDRWRFLTVYTFNFICYNIQSSLSSLCLNDLCSAVKYREFDVDFAM